MPRPWVCFQGEEFPERIHQKLRIWKEIPWIVLSRPPYLLESLFVSVHVTQLGDSCNQRVLCSFGWLCIINTYYITQSVSLLTPLSIQDRSGTLGGERSFLSPVFLNKIRWVKAGKIIQLIKKVCVKQLVRKDPNAD